MRVDCGRNEAIDGRDERHAPREAADSSPIAALGPHLGPQTKASCDRASTNSSTRETKIMTSAENPSESERNRGDVRLETRAMMLPTPVARPASSVSKNVWRNGVIGIIVSLG